MDCKRTRLFMRRWLWYTIHDAFAQTFGWLTLFGGSFGGFILARFGVPSTNEQLTSNVVGAVGGLVIGVGVYSIVGFFKTRQYMQPLALTVVDDVRSPDFAFNNHFRGYSVATIVQNRSDVHLKDCTAFVMNAPQADESIRPYFRRIEGTTGPGPLFLPLRLSALYMRSQIQAAKAANS